MALTREATSKNVYAVLNASNTNRNMADRTGADLLAAQSFRPRLEQHSCHFTCVPEDTYAKPSQGVDSGRQQGCYGDARGNKRNDSVNPQ